MAINKTDHTRAVEAHFFNYIEPIFKKGTLTVTREHPGKVNAIFMGLNDFLFSFTSTYPSLIYLSIKINA